MGHNPIAPPRRRTIVNSLSDRYVKGELTIEEFEQEIGEALRSGLGDLAPPVSTNDYQIFSQFPRPTMETINS